MKNISNIFSQINYMNAVILAGGFGSRLKPMTDVKPKPMMNVANRPMIDYTVSHLQSIGINDLIFTLAYKPEQIMEWAIGYKKAICHFSIEVQPLGTLGGVKQVEDMLDDTFIVISGDALEDIDLRAMIDFHYSSGALVTMAVAPVQNPSLYGICEVDEHMCVNSFVEKPDAFLHSGNLANCGVYIIDKKVLAGVEQNEKCDFSLDLFPKLVEKGEIYAFKHDGYWCDIGSINSYYDANFYCINNDFFAPASHFKRIELASVKTKNKSNFISCDSHIIGQIKNCIIGKNAIISSSASLENCIVLEGAIVKGRHSNCIIGNDFALQVDGKINYNADFVASTQNSTQSFNKIYKNS